MSSYRSLYAYGVLFAGTATFSPAVASETEHVCQNELACIEELYSEKQYDPADFAALKLIIGGADSLSYNDNVFRAANNEKGDFINRFTPRAVLQSNLDRHYWGVELKAENALHFSHSENNYTDFSAMADGRYDVNDSTSFSAKGGYALDHVGIGSFVDDPGALNVEPTPYHTLLGHAAIDYLPADNPWHVNVSGGADHINYENVGERSGAIDIQDDRDRIEYRGSGQVGYRVRPNSELYVKTVQEKWDHDKRIDSSSMSTRDSRQHRYLVGYRNEEQKTAGIRYDIAVGYLEQQYDASRLPDVEAIDLYADADWKLDNENNIRLRLARDVRDAYSDQRSAYLRTRARLNYEHDYNELLTLGTGYSYTNNDFESTAVATIHREDHVHGMHVWSAYEFYQDFEANLYYNYINRNSNDPTADYNANVIGVALSYKN